MNEQRDDFDDIPEESGAGGLFGGEKLSYASIHEAIDPVIEEVVAPADWKKEEVLKEIVEQFGVGEHARRHRDTDPTWRQRAAGR